MVYRGKLNLGCANCRKAKKRCGLERPACSRCVKLKKECPGSLDPTQLFIQDESENVRKKAQQRDADQGCARQPKPCGRPRMSVASSAQPSSIPARETSPQESSIDTDCTSNVLQPESNVQQHWPLVSTESEAVRGQRTSLSIDMTIEIQPKPDDVATNYFLQQFTSNGHWEFIRTFAAQQHMDPCLDLTIRACGMAALTNVELVEKGKCYARLMYSDALNLVNEALRDSQKSKLDETLIAVIMLGYYENITSDNNSRESILSWQAHIDGAAQLLKLRGKQQFQTHIGRTVYRETAAQVLTKCLWVEEDAPEFLKEYRAELQAQTPPEIAAPLRTADMIAEFYVQYTKLRSQIRSQSISNAEAAAQCADMERGLMNWEVQAKQSDFWRYHEVEVDDNEHIWDGKVFEYAGHSAPTVWNKWRVLRIMLSRTAEALSRKLDYSQERHEKLVSEARKTRRVMARGICASIPPCLGHSGSTSNESCRLATAYGVIWPLYFAGTCTIERVGYDAWSMRNRIPIPSKLMDSSAYAQSTWIVGRLEYIAHHAGLKWAYGVAGPLRGEFRLQDHAVADE